MEETSGEWVENVCPVSGTLELQSGLWCIRVGRSRAKADYRAGPRSIDHYSLHFVLEGRLRVHFGKQEEIVSAREAFCLFPHDRYRYGLVRPGESLRLFWIAFQGPQAEEVLANAGMTRAAPVRLGEFSTGLEQTLHLLFDRLRGSQQAAKRNSMWLLSCLYHIFGELMHPHSDGRNHSGQGAAISGSSWLDRAVAFIQLHYEEGIRVQDVARHVGMHRSYFSDLFAAHVGVSPARYLQTMRMGRARELLYTHNYSVTETAYALGYSNVHSLSRAFRHYHGFPPGSRR